MATAEEGEVVAEVEAVQAVYGDDCVVIDSYPPHLRVHIKPRTADVSSQQFVEAVIGIQAGSQYPKELPHVHLIDSKGIDEKRQKDLMTSIRDKACELSSYLMLVALCEEAVEKLSVMNHPDGDCPLCLYPLVPEDDQSNILPFMKLMSCFHCFHSECIIRWWTWLQSEKETNADTHGATEEKMGTCPVCRKVFHAKDFEHELGLVGSHSSQLNFDGMEVDHNESILETDSENIRRQKFEAILRLQQENSGLIEPKRDILVLPGMFLPQAASSATVSAEEPKEQQPREPTDFSKMHPGGTSTAPSTSMEKQIGMRKNRGWNSRRQFKQPAALPTTMSTQELAQQQRRDPGVALETPSIGFFNRPSTSEHRVSGMRHHRHRNSRKPVEQWIRKDDGKAE